MNSRITFTTKEKERVEYEDDTINDEFELEVCVDHKDVCRYGYLTKDQARSLRDWLTKQLGE